MFVRGAAEEPPQASHGDAQRRETLRLRTLRLLREHDRLPKDPLHASPQGQPVPTEPGRGEAHDRRHQVLPLSQLRLPVWEPVGHEAAPQDTSSYSHRRYAGIGETERGIASDAGDAGRRGRCESAVQ